MRSFHVSGEEALTAAQDGENLMLLEVEGRTCFVPANPALEKVLTDQAFTELLSGKLISGLLKMPEKEMELFRNLLKLPAGNKVTQTLLTELFFGTERSSILGLMDRFGLGENSEMLEKTLNYLMNHSSSQVEFTSAMTQLSGIKARDLLAQVLSRNVKIRYLYRGTSGDFAGKGNFIAESTSTSTDPIVSTIFALNSNYLSNAKGVLRVSKIENLNKLNVDFPNQFSDEEMEVAISLKLSDFSAYTEMEIPAEKARAILKEMGIDLPSSNSLRSINDINHYIMNARKLNVKRLKYLNKS